MAKLAMIVSGIFGGSEDDPAHELGDRLAVTLCSLGDALTLVRGHAS
jgi:hypothetical protein